MVPVGQIENLVARAGFHMGSHAETMRTPRELAPVFPEVVAGLQSLGTHGRETGTYILWDLFELRLHRRDGRL